LAQHVAVGLDWSVENLVMYFTRYYYRWVSCRFYLDEWSGQRTAVQFYALSGEARAEVGARRNLGLFGKVTSEV
jgi:hypothetical protein